MNNKTRIELAVTVLLAAVLVVVVARNITTSNVRNRERRSGASVSRPVSAKVEVKSEVVRTETIKALGEGMATVPWGRDPFMQAGRPEGETVSEFKLAGILYEQDNPQAIINDEIVGVDGIVGGWKVVSIKPDVVFLRKGDRSKELHLWTSE